MPNYQNGKIYQIWSPQTDQVYIGSTTVDLCRRMTKHRNELNCMSRDIIAYGDAKIELIEYFPCSSKIELNKREGELIRSTNCVNEKVAGRTYKEYCAENKEKISERHKKYYQNNKDHLVQTSRTWREDNPDKLEQQRRKRSETISCECGCIVSRHALVRHKRSTKHKQLMESNL